MKITKLRRNVRALSPIFAVLILIAIAVIAGIVVYMFTSGTIASLTGGGGAGAEKIAVQSASGSAVSGVTVLYQWTAGPEPTITGMLLRDASGNSLGPLTVGGTVVPTGVGVLETATGTGIAMVDGTVYSITLVTKNGGSFDSPMFSCGP